MMIRYWLDMRLFTPLTIYIDPVSSHDRLTQNAMGFARDNEIPVVFLEESPDRRFWSDLLGRELDPMTAGKKILFLTHSKGKFVRPCPSTKLKLCCNLHNIDIGSNCPFDCTYCILNSYLNFLPITMYTNLDQLTQQIDDTFSQQFLRVSPGNLTDSLGLDHILNYSSEVIRIAEKFPLVLVEFKTKSNFVDNVLANTRYLKNVVMSWSINTERVTREDEKLTATLDERLKAAKRCLHAGTKLAFHFDPMVVYENCEKEYLEVIEKVFSIFDSPTDYSQILWFSMGTLRFEPKLKEMMRTRFPESKLPLGEFVLNTDYKYRYYKPLRARLYKTVGQALLKKFPKLPLYLCMEGKDVWKDVFPKIPVRQEHYRPLYAI